MSPRTSARVDRRRRVLSDESRNEDAPERPRIFRGEDEGPLSRYDEAALHALESPIARYIPIRMFSMVIWFLCGLIPILGLMLLDQQRFRLGTYLGPDAIRIFDLTAYGSLASWLSSLLFGVAIPVILAIYSVRRNRRDDYRGRFAVWQWAILVVLLASVDTAVGLHGIVQGACEYCFGARAWGNGAAWWIGAWGLVIGATLLRLAFEMAQSRMSVGWMLAGGACYLWCAVVETNSGLQGSSMAQASQLPLVLLGHHCILFCLVNYAREVVREAMGMTDFATVEAVEQTSAKSSSRVKKATSRKTDKSTPKSAKVPSESKATSSSKRNAKSTAEPNAETPQPAPATKLRAVSADPHDDVEEAESESDTAPKPVLKMADAEDERKLTKAERRKLRKEQKQQRRKAA